MYAGVGEPLAHWAGDGFRHTGIRSQTQRRTYSATEGTGEVLANCSDDVGGRKHLSSWETLRVGRSGE